MSKEPDDFWFVMDDANNHAREEIAVFENTLSPELRVEIEARIKVINDSFVEKERQLR